jgi:hypothetical protein
MRSIRTLVRTVAALSVVAAAAATPAGADVVTHWNAITLTTAVAGNRPGPAIMLDIAMAQLAVHDALQAYQRRYRSYGPAIDGAAGSPVAAAATAAHDLLAARFPAQSASLLSQYQQYLASQGLAPDDPGVWVGQQAAQAILAARANDGSYPATPIVIVGGTGIGEWRPTPPGYAPMLAPWLGDVQRFVPRPAEGPVADPPPPHVESGAYAKAYDEVKAIGARTGGTRTPEQTDLAFFYTDNPFAQMNRALRAVAEARLADSGDRARLLALANTAAADALMVAWRHKQTYVFWRPSTAIREGEHDGNAATAGDPTWVPLIDDPPYPDYTSGANSLANAIARTLAHVLGDDGGPLVMTSNAARAVVKTRTYARFSDMADDMVDARIYQGIHFRFADQVARRQSAQVADWVYAHALRPIQ